mmetsp:Transcript_2511/g.4916  ORF Transcript_2511/g.4916 Transcript_2511/m.4916 type:complete len:227 (+) Transcript_2511:72-752(+)
MRSYKKKTVAITGVSSDEGRARALALAEAGANMVVADSNKRSADKVFQELKEKGANVVAMRGQFSLEKDYQRLIQETVKAFGTIDVVVLDKKTKKAGVWAKSHEVDVFGVLHRTKPVAHSLEEMKLKAIGETSEKVAESMMKSFADGSEIEFKVGDAVEIHGLTKAELTHHNGEKGTVSTPSKEGYCRVRMDNGKSLDIRSRNLKPEIRRVKTISIKVLFLGSPKQ